MSEKGRGLGQLQIAGKLRSFQVNGLRQTKSFCEIRGVELDEYWQEVGKLANHGLLANMEIAVAFIYSALYAGARKERQVVDFDYEDVLDWFEDADEVESQELLKPIVLFSEIVNKASEELKKVQGQQA